MKNIFVLTDFSDNATHAAEYAYQLAVKTKAALTLCNADTGRTLQKGINDDVIVMICFH